MLVGGTLLFAVNPGAGRLEGSQVPLMGGASSHYSSVAVSSPSREAAIAAIEQLTNPSDIIGSQGLQLTLGTSNLPSQDPVVRYMQALSNFSSSMQQIKSGLQLAQASASSGDENRALLTINRLVALRNQTGTLLETLYTMLNLIQSEPNVNQDQIRAIRQRLDGLERAYTEYSIEIDQLRSEVTPRTVFLNILVSSPTVFVMQPLAVSGLLQTRNGTAMAQRNITITWAENQLTVPTNANGTYRAIIAFPLGYPNGTAIVGASFHPTGADANVFVTTNATALTQLEYYPTQIVAETSSESTLPLDSVTVTGTLTTATATPLENRTLQVLLDNNIIGSVGTGTNGVFTFTFQVPPSTSDGNHTVGVSFIPTGEIYAPSVANVGLSVQREQIEISAIPSLNSLLSGMTLKVTGAVSFARGAINNQGTFRGNATVLLDEVPYGSSTVGDDGVFSLNLPIPLGAGFGAHSVEVVYVPVDPQMDTSVKAYQIYVYNSEFVAVAAIAAVLTPKLIVVRRKRRRERRVRSRGLEVWEEPLTVIRELKRPMTAPQWDSALKMAEREKDASRKVVQCYRLAQNLIAIKFDENIDDAETHSEFFRRVVALKPPLAPDLNRLVELFEFAEYSPFTIPVSDGDEAKDRLLKIRDADWLS